MVPAKYESPYAGVDRGTDVYRVMDLDLDGVCADYTEAMRQWLVHAGRMAADMHPDMRHYEMTSATGWPFQSVEEYKQAHREAEANHLYATMPVIQGAPEALQRLADEHVYIRVVTHRLFVSGQHQIVVSDTAKWLDDNHIPYMSLCFTGLKDTMHATIHIDDSPANILALRQAGEHVVVFDQPYNRQLDGPRLSAWDETSVPKLMAWMDQWCDDSGK